MAPSPPRLRILSVGGNAVSAFLSWRLQATNSCDVTLVWKNGYDHVSSYGISFKSKQFGNERFKPRHVVRNPEDATSKESAFDYVLLCVKALPDVYDLARVIQSAVTPEHTCIIVNTTHNLGVEAYLEERFPTNVVLSLVSGVDLKQLNSSEFEHANSSEVWVGSANKNDAIPAAIQNDMAEALAMTLSSGQVDCVVSENIRQQQFEKMIGPIAFHPASVLFETPQHAQLLEKVGVREMVNDTIDELLLLAEQLGCTFPEDFKEKTIATMVGPSESQSIMYQDYVHRQPMEVETYLGTPISLAKQYGVKVPRLETLYTILYDRNVANMNKPVNPTPASPIGGPPQQRMVSAPQRPPMNFQNGSMRGGRAPSMTGPPPPRHGGTPLNGPMNGYPRTPNGMPPRGPPQQLNRRPSLEDNNLEEFSHLMLYDDVQEGGVPANGSYSDLPAMAGAPPGELTARERDYMMRQNSAQFRGPPMPRGRGMGPGRRMPRRPQYDEDDEDDYVDPMEFRGPPQPMIDPEQIDMMSVTSRRNRKTPSAQQLRKDPEQQVNMGMGGRPASSFGRRFGGGGRNRVSAQIMQSIPGLHDSLMNDPMMGYSSNRYGNVDRKNMQDESRANSLTAGRLNEMGQGGRPMMAHQDSYNGMPQDGQQLPGGRPSPPGMMRAPVPRYPPGQGNAVAPQQVEQHAGVSTYPKVPSNVPSLTGSASASAGSGESTHNNESSEPSAQSSTSSLGPRQAIGVRQ